MSGGKQDTDTNADTTKAKGKPNESDTTKPKQCANAPYCSYHVPDQSWDFCSGCYYMEGYRTFYEMLK